MKNMYRLQLPPNGDYTEWRSFDNIPKENYCLSVQISENSDEELVKNFMNKNFYWQIAS